MYSVLSTHPLHPDAQAIVETAAALHIAEDLAPETIVRNAREADIVIVRAPVPEAIFTDCPRLRAAVRHGAGVDMIPVDAATRSGVLVANVPGVNARSVAEHVIFTALGLARRFREVDWWLRKDGWLAGRHFAELGSELAGRVMGIIGLGAVGRQVAALAGALGMQVVGSSRSGQPDMQDGITRKPIGDVLREADIVVLACPLNAQTRGLIDAQKLSLMKKSAFLINVARGAVVDEEALIGALESGTIAGAALDVLTEQPIASGSPLLRFPNVIITPHMAGITRDSMRAMGVGAAEETLRILAGEKPVNLINPEAYDGYLARFSAQ